MKNARKCDKCGKVAEEKATINMKQPDGTPIRLIMLTCGHSIQAAGIKSLREKLDELTSLDGKQLFPFQKDGVEAIERNSGVQGLFDEMGLGKTVQAIAFCALHLEETTPCLIICKSGLKTQIAHEIIRWANTPLVQVIESTIERAWPGFLFYIVSYDLLNHVQKRNKENGGVLSMFNAVEFKTVILDEVQQIKNPDSSRTKWVRKIIREKKVEKILALSGTPFKNNFGEAYVVMNLLAPEKFPTETGFISRWCDWYYSGMNRKIGGLRKDLQENWKEFTKGLIIRRTREEVMPDLPKVNRKFQFVDLEEVHRKAYAKQMTELLDYYDEVDGQIGFEQYSNILAMLSRLRHIAGLSKVRPCQEFVEEFLLATERKIVIFTHHLDVAETIKSQLDGVLADGGYQPVVHYKSGADFHELTQEFKKPGYRVAVASTLAAGEGLNLQFCSDAIMLERQWNPPNEEQAEARFTRIGSEADSVDINYILAIGTVDDHFTQLVERKRAMLKRSHGQHVEELEEKKLVLELMDVLRAKGRAMWQL